MLLFENYAVDGSSFDGTGISISHSLFFTTYSSRRTLGSRRSQSKNESEESHDQREKHEDSGHAVYRNWCAACVEGRGVGGQHRIELLEEEERERTTPIVAFDYGFLTQKNADTSPILVCRDSRYGQTGATCCERKGPTTYPISFLVGFIQDLGFRRITLKCDNEPTTKALHEAVIQANVGGSDSTRTT